MRAAVAAGDPYHIAILDFQMPKMDGETLGRAIVEAADLRSTSLVMMSSVAHQEHRQRFIETGFSSYLVKPVRPSTLMDVLATVWGEHLNSAKTEDATTSQPAKNDRPAHSSAPPDNLVTGRILVAEDNIVNQRVAVRMLENMDQRVDVAANGREAITMQTQFAYDLIFMDCQMPEIDGYEAPRRYANRKVKTATTYPL